MSNRFEAEIRLSAVQLGIYYQKLPVPIRIDTAGAAIKLGETPYDAFLIDRGIHVAIELKSQENYGPFPITRVPDHQVDGLKSVIAHGGRAYLLINTRQNNGKREVRAWAIDFSKWDDLCLAIYPRKSVPTEFLENEDWFIEIPRIRSGDDRIWDLGVLLGTERHSRVVEEVGVGENPCL